MFLFLLVRILGSEPSMSDLLILIPGTALGSILGSIMGAIYFAPVAIFCGFCLGLANSLVFWHGHVAPKRREILRLQGEHPEVPDEALSRTAPPGEPEPTPASLSRAEAPEEEAPPRQAAGVDRATEAGEQGVEAKR
jgi:hypothetical protein